MADDEAGARPFREERLQPEDALDVEVVRWLIHEQDVRLGRELARDRQAFLPSPGEHGDLLAPTREPCAAEGLGDATRTVGIIHGGQCRRHHVLHGAPSREGRVLRHVTDPHSAAERAPAAVGRLDPGEDLQKGGLAGPVRAHEPHLVPFEEPERQLVEEGPGAVSLADRLTTQKERPGHAELFRLARLSLPGHSRCSGKYTLCSCIGRGPVLPGVDPRPSRRHLRHPGHPRSRPHGRHPRRRRRPSSRRAAAPAESGALGCAPKARDDDGAARSGMIGA